MDPATVKDLEYYLSHYWSLLAVAFIVYFGGLGAKRLVAVWVPPKTPRDKQPTWYLLWASTIDWHPMVVGGLLGAVPWPVPWYVSSWYARVLMFAAIGAISGQLYRAVKRSLELIPELIRARFGAGGGGGASSDPGALPGGDE